MAHSGSKVDRRYLISLNTVDVYLYIELAEAIYTQLVVLLNRGRLTALPVRQSGSVGSDKFVAYSRCRQNQLGLVGIIFEFVTQARYMHVDRAGKYATVKSPNGT
jgi:hypothetical protein